MKSYCLFLFMILSIGSVKAQTINSRQTSIEGFEYTEIIRGTDNGKLPLLIAFHYSGGTPSETIADYDNLKYPVRIIMPKGNHRKRNEFSYYPADYYQKDSSTQWNLAKITVDSIAKFVRAVELKYKSTAIVSGISQGGDIAFLLAVFYPELCKASLPFAAVIHSNINKELSNKSSASTPIYLFQGENDAIVSVRFTRDKVKEIGKKLNLQLRTYPNLGHGISPKMKMDYSGIIDQYLSR
jgi:predicted esterase